MVMEYSNKYFVELMDWLYVRHDQIKPRDLSRNQEETQATYNVKDPIGILFNQMDMGQGFKIDRKFPFFNWQLADMGVTRILATQEYTHTYCMCKRIPANERTRVCFKANF